MRSKTSKIVPVSSRITMTQMIRLEAWIDGQPKTGQKMTVSNAVEKAIESFLNSAEKEVETNA